MRSARRSIATNRPRHYPQTPDGRYFVVSGRLWRKTRPDLSEDKRQSLVAELMAARRGIATARRSGDLAQERAYRHTVHEAKVALGERGPVWWSDGAPDFNRYMAVNTPYAEWFSQLGESGD